jgi:hypothetical protein
MKVATFWDTEPCSLYMNYVALYPVTRLFPRSVSCEDALHLSCEDVLHLSFLMQWAKALNNY